MENSDWLPNIVGLQSDVANDKMPEQKSPKAPDVVISDSSGFNKRENTNVQSSDRRGSDNSIRKMSSIEARRQTSVINHRHLESDLIRTDSGRHVGFISVGQRTSKLNQNIRGGNDSASGLENSAGYREYDHQVGSISCIHSNLLVVWTQHFRSSYKNYIWTVDVLQKVNFFSSFKITPSDVSSLRTDLGLQKFSCTICDFDMKVISKEAVGNSWDILNAILGHRYDQNHSSSHTKRIKPKCEFYHMCVFQY